MKCFVQNPLSLSKAAIQGRLATIFEEHVTSAKQKKKHGGGHFCFIIPDAFTQTGKDVGKTHFLAIFGP